MNNILKWSISRSFLELHFFLSTIWCSSKATCLNCHKFLQSNYISIALSILYDDIWSHFEISTAWIHAEKHIAHRNKHFVLLKALLILFQIYFQQMTLSISFLAFMHTYIWIVFCFLLLLTLVLLQNENFQFSKANSSCFHVSYLFVRM